MQRHFDADLAKLREKLFRMGQLVEEAVQSAGEALMKRDNQLAQGVIERDEKINILEIQIDELGHELIALMQPAAKDLRFITMVLKMNGDLERMGDQAVNIAQKAMELNKEAPCLGEFDMSQMVRRAIRMLRDALDAFSHGDAAQAKMVCEQDDEIDEMNDRINQELQQALKDGRIQFPQAISLIMVAHNLERVGDLATNIAEDVIYVAKGIDIRHHITERREE